MTSLYNLFTKHHMDPDYVMSRSDMGRRLLLAFSQYEIEQEEKVKKQNQSKPRKRGGR